MLLRIYFLRKLFAIRLPYKHTARVNGSIYPKSIAVQFNDIHSRALGGSLEGYVYSAAGTIKDSFFFLIVTRILFLYGIVRVHNFTSQFLHSLNFFESQVFAEWSVEGLTNCFFTNSNYILFINITFHDPPKFGLNRDFSLLIQQSHLIYLAWKLVAYYWERHATYSTLLD